MYAQVKIGSVKIALPAKKAESLKKGDKILNQYGYLYHVAKIVDKTAKTILVELQYNNYWNTSGIKLKRYNRKTLVAIN
jgi:preprotein translocase subunit YajC